MKACTVIVAALLLPENYSATGVAAVQSLRGNNSSSCNGADCSVLDGSNVLAPVMMPVPPHSGEQQQNPTDNDSSTTEFSDSDVHSEVHSDKEGAESEGVKSAHKFDRVTSFLAEISEKEGDNAMRDRAYILRKLVSPQQEQIIDINVCFLDGSTFRDIEVDKKSEYFDVSKNQDSPGSTLISTAMSSTIGELKIWLAAIRGVNKNKINIFTTNSSSSGTSESSDGPSSLNKNTSLAELKRNCISDESLKLYVLIKPTVSAHDLVADFVRNYEDKLNDFPPLLEAKSGEIWVQSNELKLKVELRDFAPNSFAEYESSMDIEIRFSLSRRVAFDEEGVKMLIYHDAYVQSDQDVLISGRQPISRRLRIGTDFPLCQDGSVLSALRDPNSYWATFMDMFFKRNAVAAREVEKRTLARMPPPEGGNILYPLYIDLNFGDNVKEEWGQVNIITDEDSFTSKTISY